METDDTVREQASAVQARLPLDLDAPIPFELTARARRLVAPASLPALEVVPSTEGGAELDGTDLLEDPGDTRAARARALRRAGMSIEGIAQELELEPFVVSTLVDDVGPVASARRRLRSLDGGRVASPASVEDAAKAERIRQRFETARIAARDEVAEPLTSGDDFTVGLGLATGSARIDPHAVLFTVRDRDVAAAISGWLQRHLLPDEDGAARLRVILRIAPQLAGDLARHAWAEALSVPMERITVTRWRTAPDPESAEATIRIADPACAGRLAGWRDAVLGALVPADTR